MQRKRNFVLALGFLLTTIFLTVSSSTAEGEDTRIYSVAWSPDSTKIAAGYADGSIRIWSAIDDALLSELTGHTANVYTLAWNSGGGQLASGGEDGTVRIWEANHGQLLQTIENVGDYIYAVAWVAHDTQIVSGSAGIDFTVPTLRLWDVWTGVNLENANGGSIGRILVNANGETFATTNVIASVSIWEISTLQRQGGFSVSLDRATYTTGDNFNAMAVSSDSSQIATGNVDGTVRVWNAITGQVILTLDANDAQTVDWTVSAVQELHFNENATQLFAVSSNGTLRGWELATGQVISNIQLASPIYAAAWSPDGSSIAYGGAFGRDGRVTVYTFQPVPMGTPPDTNAS